MILQFLLTIIHFSCYHLYERKENCIILQFQRVRKLETEKTLKELIEWVCNFDDKRLIEEIKYLEHLIGCDVAKECVLFDYVLALYDALRDECVKRVAERM